MVSVDAVAGDAADQPGQTSQLHGDAWAHPVANVRATVTVTGSGPASTSISSALDASRALSPSRFTPISTCVALATPSHAPDAASPVQRRQVTALPHLAHSLAPLDGKDLEDKEDKGHQDQEESADSTTKDLRDPAQLALAPGREPVAVAAATHPHPQKTQSDLSLSTPSTLESHSQDQPDDQQPSSTPPIINIQSLPASPPLSPPSPSPLLPPASLLHIDSTSPHLDPSLSFPLASVSSCSAPSPSIVSFASATLPSSSFAPSLPLLPTLPATVFNPELQPPSPVQCAGAETYSPPFTPEHHQGHSLDHSQDHDHDLPKMIFSDLYKSPKSPFAKLRHLSSNTNSAQQPTLAELIDYGDPDLISRDKSKQKDAVRRYLAKHIRNDWDFTWPATRKSPEANAAAEARAAAIRRKIVQAEQVGLLQPTETFASPLSPITDAAETTTTVSLAIISAAVADAADYDTESDSDAESVYSTISEDAIHFRPRAEWTSDFSDDDRGGSYYQRMPVYVHSPFRFDSPDAVGGAASKNATPDERKAKARRAVRAEMTWNDGLACFNARRDAWTGAQTVRVKPAKPVVSSSPSSPRRSLFRFHSHKSEQAAAPAVLIPAMIATVPSPGPVLPLSPVMSNSRHSQYSQQSHQTQQSRNSQQSAGLDTVATTPITSDDGAEGVDGAGGVLLHQASSNTAPIKLTRSRATQGSSRRNYSHQPGSVQHPEYAVQILIPVAHPLLPPNNPMRQSITPALYLSLYDKLVTGLTQPSCPINLSDMIRSCVAGWKRDNEWPPRAEPPMMPTLRILPSSSSTTAAARRRKEGRTPPGGPFHRMRLLSKQPTVVLPTTTTATVGAASVMAAAAVDEKGDDITGNHGIRRSLQRVLRLDGNGRV